MTTDSAVAERGGWYYVCVLGYVWSLLCLFSDALFFAVEPHVRWAAAVAVDSAFVAMWRAAMQSNDPRYEGSNWEASLRLGAWMVIAVMGGLAYLALRHGGAW